MQMCKAILVSMKILPGIDLYVDKSMCFLLAIQSLPNMHPLIHSSSKNKIFLKILNPICFCVIDDFYLTIKQLLFLPLHSPKSSSY